MSIRLHRTQAEFRRSQALYRGFVGGRGSGKSWIGAYDMIRRAKPGRTYLVGSPTSILMQDTTFPTFKGLAQQLGVWDERAIRLTPYPTATLTTGATIRFRTADDPQKMRGPNLSGALLDEASLMHEDVFKIVIACLREGADLGWLSAAFTPKGRLHWTYQTFGAGRPDTAIFQCRMRDNPFLHPDFAAKMIEQYGEGTALAEQELDGKWVNLEGAEWPPSYFDGPGFWFDDWPDLQHLLIRTVAIDPSKGTEAKRGDFAAIIKFGLDARGVEYVEADLSKSRPMAAAISADGIELDQGMIETAVDWAHHHQAQGVFVETNQFAVLLKIPFEHACKRRGCELNFVGLNNTENKGFRIRRLTSPLSQRKVRFKSRSRGTSLLVEQLKRFQWPTPDGEHDDGPDALEMARRGAVLLHNRPGLRKDQPKG